jgi:hypothetical protein
MFRFVVRMLSGGEDAFSAAAMSWDRVRWVWRESRVRGVVVFEDVEVDIFEVGGGI